MTKNTSTSAVEQNNDTKPAVNENDVNQTADTGNDTPDSVPYARFNEINKELKSLKDVNAKLKEKQESERVAKLEEQNKWQELYTEQQSENKSLKEKLAYHNEMEAKDRESLLMQMSEEHRKIAEDLSTPKLKKHANLMTKNTALRTDKSAPVRGNTLGIKNDADIWEMDKSERSKNWTDVIRHFKKK